MGTEPSSSVAWVSPLELFQLHVHEEMGMLPYGSNRHKPHRVENETPLDEHAHLETYKIIKSDYIGISSAIAAAHFPP